MGTLKLKRCRGTHQVADSRFYKIQNNNPSSKICEKFEQVPSKEKSKFSGTSYMEQTFRCK